MSQKVILITGALTGIGRAVATVFAKEGAHVVVSGRSSKVGNELADALCATGAQVEFLRADVRCEAEVKVLVSNTIRRFGHIDVAVNAAGTDTIFGPLIDRTVQEYADTFDTNVLGTFLCAKYELAAMLPRRRGSIVNMSSDLGRHGAAGSSISSASRHAIEGLTLATALEAAASNIRINAVAPGPIDTGSLAPYCNASNKATLIDGVPLKRLGTFEEVARVIAFLSSDRASFITGQIIGVDGGMTS